MGDMGRSCAKAQVTAHHAIAENLEWRKSWEQFPKNPRMRKVGECFITALPHPALPPLPFCRFIFLLSPRTSGFTRAPAANPKIDLRDVAEEESWKPKEGDRRS